MEVKVKDIYDKVRSGEIAKWRFTEWLGMYGFKYKERGFNQGWKACEEEHMMLQQPLSDNEIHDIWKSLWEGGNIGHIAYNYARAIEERHGIK